MPDQDQQYRKKFVGETRDERALREEAIAVVELLRNNQPRLPVAVEDRVVNLLKRLGAYL